MNISKLTNGLLVSLLLTASVAGADDDYPATDFQPKVVFQDSDYKHSGSSSDDSSSSKAKSADTGEVSVADSNYPAANFEPEVLYKDEDYKHKPGKVISSSSSTSSSDSTSTSTSATTTEVNSDESSLDLIIGLSLLAVAGFVFYRNNASNKGPTKRKVIKKKKATKKSAEPSVRASTDGVVSGVSKYLEGKVGATPSGVAKYLEEKNTSVSRVSKYVAKQKVSARVASVTGVEKYLKDKG
ncbi:MAG: hypothetical protein L3J59_09955 [Methylococcaceae bacterium]|nr:hypothetical protein [Methylococcaceae bacterium]